MRAGHTGRRRAVIVSVAVAAVGALGVVRAVGPAAGPADPPWVLEPGAEATDADKRGAKDVEAAQKLARAKKFAEAVAILERVARAHPSSAHDCNLALAYLRAGDLTRAQLVWDLARLRTSTPPAWCTSSLAGELATALRDRSYVPLTINVTPADAVVRIGGVAVRSLYVVWLPAGTHAIAASAPGMIDQSTQVAVAPPSARITIVLESPPVDPPPVDPPPVEPIDAAVAEPTTPVDAAAAPPPAPIDAAVAVPPRYQVPTPAPGSYTPAWIGLGVGAVAGLTGAIFHVKAAGTREDANRLQNDTLEFQDARDRFGTQRALAIGGYAVSGVALGFAAWWLLERADAAPTRTRVGLRLGDDGAMVTAEWALAGAP
ncbi:MAG TPA: hypothetical protein VM734_29900 [Kofleriaceae bacterium]|nr:hypothetical protein [Kofleriaceae bacterium]